MKNKIEKHLLDMYEWIDSHTYGVARILRIALYTFGESNATQSAAGMAYYAFFSIFYATINNNLQS